LKRRGRVNARTDAAGEARDFSTQIRQGVPGMGWMPKEGG